MNRRLFLIRSLLFASIVAARPKLTFAGKKERILVVGAGMSGITAARMLTDHGFDVTILEARQELGGRIRQDTSFGLPLDLGASFITTSRGNPLVPLAEKFGATTYNTELDDGEYVDDNGKFFSTNNVKKAEALYEELKEKISETGEELEIDQPVSKIILEFLDEVRTRDGATMSDFAKFIAISDITGDYAADPSEYSTHYFENDGEFSGPDLIVTSGYRSIINGLARGLDIKTNITVKKITHTNLGVSIETSAGKFDADRVIVTVPLSILKKGSIVFSPALPKEKTVAIERLGMGLLDKLYLKFPTSFWQKNDPAIGYFGNIKSLNGSEYPDFYFLDRALKEPIALLFVGGSQARAFEKLNKEVLVDKAMTTLKRVYGSKIPDPTNSLSTSWGGDPYTYGSYSFAAVGSKPADYDALAETVNSRLFFAGEATNRKYSASVHGAYLSGVREANRVIELVS